MSKSSSASSIKTPSVSKMVKLYALRHKFIATFCLLAAIDFRDKLNRIVVTYLRQAALVIKIEHFTHHLSTVLF